ncbi:hypothetical protein HDV00_010864 [Rhizophlyctis rosea]|nr:hypothetical protein HDV00_010864 [Rhizophlyctis rosea]
MCGPAQVAQRPRPSPYPSDSASLPYEPLHTGNSLVISYNDLDTLKCQAGPTVCDMGCVDLEDFGSLLVGVTSDSSLVGLFGRNRHRGIPFPPELSHQWLQACQQKTNWYHTVVEELGVRVQFLSIKGATPHSPRGDEDLSLLVDSRQCALGTIGFGLSVVEEDGVNVLKARDSKSLSNVDRGIVKVA